MPAILTLCRIPVFGIALLVTLMASHVQGQILQYATGTSSNQLKRDATALIPFQELDPQMAQKVADVVDNTSIFRQLPLSSIQSDPDLYLFLVRYPEVVISTWRLMGVTQMAATRTAPFQLQSNDGAGTTMDVELIYGTPQLNIYYAEGEYDGPMLLRSVQGQCVLVMESEYGLDAQGEVQVTSRLHVFLKINNMAANMIAKTLHPLIGSTADHNFVESLKFLERLSKTSQENGPGVQGMADRMDGICPEVRQQFKEIAGIAYERALQRTHAYQIYQNQTAVQQVPATFSNQAVISDQAAYQTPANAQRHHNAGRYPYPN